MRRGKWIAATVLAAMGLTAGAFAENHPRSGQDRDGTFYSQHDTRDRAQAWNHGYRDDDGRYRRDDDRGQFRDRDDHDRRAQERDHRDRDRDYRYRDRDDRGR